jgi:hypothetical protein
VSRDFMARRAGLVSIAAATLILVSQISQLIIPMVLPESFWIATHSLRMGLALVAIFVLLLALTALYSRQAAGSGNLAVVGYLAAFLGTLLVAGDWWYEAFIGPVLREQAPELLATAPSGSILVGAVITAGTFAAGWFTVGLSTFRARTVPRGAAILMIAAGVPAILALVAPFQIPLALAVGWMGVSLVRTEATERVTTAAAPWPAA